MAKQKSRKKAPARKKKTAARKAARSARKPARRKVARKVARAAAPAPHPLTPYLCVKDAADALEFYRKALGARETLRMTGSDGRIGHAEIEVRGAMVMLSDEWPEGNVFSPTTVGGSSVTLHLYVPDVDAVVARAADARAVVERAPADMPYGDRAATLLDPFGHRWMISTKVEDVSKEEMEKRFGGQFTVS
jgi:PhnB protein